MVNTQQKNLPIRMLPPPMSKKADMHACTLWFHDFPSDIRICTQITKNSKIPINSQDVPDKPA
jgi:hypothetical protein